MVCGLCGGKMIRGNRSHGLVHWKCQNSDCGQSISFNDEALAELVDGQLPDPTPAHDVEQLRVRLEQGPADAGALAALLATAVRAVRITPDKNVELELVNGEITTDVKEERA